MSGQTIPAVCAGAICAATMAVAAAPFTSPDLLMRFDAPAKRFTESAPLGNGRLGAMVFGGVGEERIVLNESSMWSGSPQDADRLEAAQSLPGIRRLLLEGRNAEAEKLVNENFTCRGPGSGRAKGKDLQFGCYQTLGDLRLTFPGAGSFADYARELDLSRAVATVRYRSNGTAFGREAFVSAPDQTIVVRLTADRPGKVSFQARLVRTERFTTATDGANGLIMTGQLHNGTDGKGVRYVLRLRAVSQRGHVSVAGNVLSVEGADQALLLLTAATDYPGFSGKVRRDPARISADDLARAVGKSWTALLAAHVADYRHWFDRVSLRLGNEDPVAASRATPVRLRAFAQGRPDPGLAALYFQFGRYLLISSSRPHGLPANLQGIWAEELQTPWNGDWHLDINVQMNYWPAETGNLSDLHQPLFALIESLQKPGERTASAYYGARGWVAHVITNAWGFTSPGENAHWGATTSGSAWLCQHLWDHYLFTGDKRFLEWAYPIMKGSARFYADILIEEPRRKWLVTAPANSPENRFLLPDKLPVSVCMGPTVDMQLLRYLFSACIDASRILGTDNDFRAELEAKRARLAPTRVGSDGRILEWLEEYPEQDPKHRHMSHMWGLYPGDEITPWGTPALAEAARKSLDVRGDGANGWSLAYKAALWARLGDGDRAHRLFSNLLHPVSQLPMRDGVRVRGGSYDNLFDACPPFQIDANFGGAAAVAEMLLQSHGGSIRLLPALPGAWPEGKVRGLQARGGFTVDLEWRQGRLTEAVLRSLRGTRCKIAYRHRTAEQATVAGRTYRLGASLELKENR
jgi:alpha-L-fucosidase 2